MRGFEFIFFLQGENILKSQCFLQATHLPQMKKMNSPLILHGVLLTKEQVNVKYMLYYYEITILLCIWLHVSSNYLFTFIFILYC